MIETSSARKEGRDNRRGAFEADPPVLVRMQRKKDGRCVCRETRGDRRQARVRIGGVHLAGLEALHRTIVAGCQGVLVDQLVESRGGRQERR